MRSSKLRWLLATLTVALLPTSADAGLITTKMDTSTPIMTFSILSRMNGESGYVGPNSVSLDGGPITEAYCTDLFRSIGVNDQYQASTQKNLSTLPGYKLLTRLFSADAALGGSSQAANKAALQLAVWDVVESARAGVGPLDPLTVGMLNSTGYHVAGLIDITSNSVDMISVMGRVSGLLNLAPSRAAANLTYIATDTGYGQGFVEVAAVPEPSTFISAGLGLIGLVIMKARRRPAAA